MMRVPGAIVGLALVLLIGSAAMADDPASDERPVLVAAGEPTVATGMVAKNQDILTVPARHGITGVLQNEIVISDWFKREALMPGQPLYGLPMRGQVHWTRPWENFIVWCAPRRVEGKTGRSAIQTYCIAPKGKVYAAVEADNPLLSRDFDMRNDKIVHEPEVAVEAADIGIPMTAAYRVWKWGRDKVYLHLLLRTDDYEYFVGIVEAPRLGDGAALLKISGGLIAIVPHEKGVVEVRVLQPLTDEGALPL